MRIVPVPGRYAVVRLDPDAAIPQWAGGSFVSITRTEAELSIVCDEAHVPAGARHEPGWRCLGVAGPIPFDTTGIAASLASPLAAAGVSIFLVATFDTDYLLVKHDAYERACDALRRAGHEIALPHKP